MGLQVLATRGVMETWFPWHALVLLAAGLGWELGPLRAHTAAIRHPSVSALFFLSLSHASLCHTAPHSEKPGGTRGPGDETASRRGGPPASTPSYPYAPHHKQTSLSLSPAGQRMTPNPDAPRV